MRLFFTCIVQSLIFGFFFLKKNYCLNLLKIMMGEVFLYRLSKLSERFMKLVEDCVLTSIEQHFPIINKIYYKRLYASDFPHIFLYKLFYHRNVLNNFEHLKPFVFYDLQDSYSSVIYPRNHYELMLLGPIEPSNPLTWLNKNVGIGFKVDLLSNLFLFQKLGAGVCFILGRDRQLLNLKFNGFDWKFGYVFNVGIG